MTKETSAGDAQTIADLAVKAKGEPTTIQTVAGREFLILPSGFSHHDVTPPHSQAVNTPKRITQSVTLQNADAMIEYLNRFKGDDSLLFADVQKSLVVAAIDYHAKDKASLVTHRASLQLPFSEEWKVWSEISGRLLPQLEFARFVEENAPDIKAPDAATLLETVRDLQARRSVNFIQAVRTASDNESFEFSDNTEARTAKGDVELPTKFLLNIPVYFGEPDGEVPAFLRWKLDDGKLQLGIKLNRMEHIRQAAFKMIVAHLHERTDVLPVFGTIGG